MLYEIGKIVILFSRACEGSELTLGESNRLAAVAGTMEPREKLERRGQESADARGAGKSGLS